MALVTQFAKFAKKYAKKKGARSVNAVAGRTSGICLRKTSRPVSWLFSLGSGRLVSGRSSTRCFLAVGDLGTGGLPKPTPITTKSLSSKDLRVREPDLEIAQTRKSLTNKYFI